MAFGANSGCNPLNTTARWGKPRITTQIRHVNFNNNTTEINQSLSGMRAQRGRCSGPRLGHADRCTPPQRMRNRLVYCFTSATAALFFCFATKALLPTAAGQNHAQATSRTLHKRLPSMQHVVKEQIRRPCTVDLPHFIARNRAPSSISVTLRLLYTWSRFTDTSAKGYE